jgi:hypothetical protein
VDADDVATSPRRCSCGRNGIWQHPESRTWACELHAPEHRWPCDVCGKPAAWLDPGDHLWLCLEHMPRGAS